MKANTLVLLTTLLSVVAANPHGGKVKTNKAKAKGNANANANAAECAALTTSTSSCTVITTTIVQAAAATNTGAAATATPAASGTNIQKFTGTLGGAPPPVISGTGNRPFSVNGNTFVGAGAALGRSCDIQHNACANAANSGALAGGVGQCETQLTQCKNANILARRRQARRAAARRNLQKRQQAGDFGSCSNPTIVFKEGLDGRNQAAFIAENQADFNHGSALNIGVIAGFICQRLGSPCNAPADVQASCSSASAAAVATTQNQAAADAFNLILAGGAGGGAAAASPTATATASPVGNNNSNNNNQECSVAPATTAAPALATTALETVVMTITSCT